MTVMDAKRYAKVFVADRYLSDEGFMGAFLGGSTAFMNNNADFPFGSDIDVRVLYASEQQLPVNIRDHFECKGAIIEPSYRVADEIFDLDRLLDNPYSVSDLVNGDVLSDPSGRLEQIQREIQNTYKNDQHIMRRCRGLGKVIDRLAGAITEPVRALGPVVTIFSIIVSTLAQLPLVATLQNPTIRRALAESKLILEKWNNGDLYGELLSLIGGNKVAPEVVKVLTGRCLKTFDYAVTVISSFFPAADFIDAQLRERWATGMSELIDSGNSDESLPFILHKYGASMTAIENDAPDSAKLVWRRLFEQTLEELGLNDRSEILRRVTDAQNVYYRMLAVVEEHISTDPNFNRG
jgi:hypothetical protein